MIFTIGTFQDQSRVNAGPNTKSMPTYTVPQRSSLDYAWDAPAAREKKIVLVVGISRREVDIMEIGDLVPFKFAVSCRICCSFTNSTHDIAG